MYIINVLLTQIHVMNANIQFWSNIHFIFNLKLKIILKEYQELGTIYTRANCERVAA